LKTPSRRGITPNDDIFRLVSALGFGIVFPIGSFYRLKSQASGEKLDRREEGLFVLLTLRPIAAVEALAFFTYLIKPEWMGWSTVPLPRGFRWFGVGLGVLAAVLFITTLHTLGTNLTDTVVTRSNHTLVTRGVYRWVRHPFYVATALAIAAAAIVSANWFLGLAGAMTMALLIQRTRTEERNLVARFGDAYTKYMASTGRFIPRFRSSADKPRPNHD